MSVVIVGGGLAGAGAAIRLARAGHHVDLLEREREPRHKICGEFLSGEARTMLDRLGLDVARLGGAEISRLRLVSGQQIVEAPLPFRALGLTRRRLDEALLDLAAAAGANVARGVAVRAIDGTGVRTNDTTIDAANILIASGKHDVRGARRDTRGCDDRFVGFKTYWRLPERARAALDGMIEVVLFNGGYAGLQMVEGGLANLCLLVRRDALAAIGGDWPSLLAYLVREPHLGRRLADGEQMLARPLTITGVPYGYRPSSIAPGDPHYRLGDQAAVIPSFCGDGMAIALHSANVATDAILAGASPDVYHRRLGADLSAQVGRATIVQRIGGHEWLRPLMIMGLSVAPSVLTRLARATRIKDSAVDRATMSRASGVAIA